MKPPEGFPTKDAVAAYRPLSEYWRALEDSDEEALSRLLSPATVERNGWTRGAMAGQIRERIDASIDDCRLMGVSAVLRVLPGGEFAFIGAPPPSVRTWLS